MRVGIGYDVHQLVNERPLVIGGVTIPYEKGLLGHSDADVLLHAIMDAILGALALGDIGRLFPDSSDAFKDISSIVLLEKVKEKMDACNLMIGNIDATIVAQKPKMAPYISQMIANLSQTLKCSADRLNIKATTTEKLGFEGEEKGISSQAVVLLVKKGEADE